MADWPDGALEFAKQSRIARLATSGADGAPQTRLIRFGSTFAIEMKGADGLSVFAVNDHAVEQ